MTHQDVTVLLVEDDPICRQVERHLLEHLGFMVETAKNAQEAFELVNARRVDLLSEQYRCIFMDIGLPDIDGDYVTEMMRKTEGWTKPTPIIAVTARDTTEDKDRFIKKGISDVIVKPLTIEKLNQSLKSIL